MDKGFEANFRKAGLDLSRRENSDTKELKN